MYEMSSFTKFTEEHVSSHLFPPGLFRLVLDAIQSCDDPAGLIRNEVGQDSLQKEQHVLETHRRNVEQKGKGMLYIAQYPVHWTTQSALHLPGRHVHSETNSTSLGSILATQQLRPLIFPPLSIARYSFIQLNELGHRGENENAQTF